MKTIAFCKTKGGVGASTLCFHISLYVASEGTPVCIVDQDPQEALTRMWEARSELINPLLIHGVDSITKTAREFNAENCDREFMFVDTPGSITPVIRDAVNAADLIVVPVQWTYLDISAQAALLDLIGKSNLTYKTQFVMTRVPPNGGQADVEKSKKYLQQFSPHPIPMMFERLDYGRAGAGGRAAWEREVKKNNKNQIVRDEIGAIWSSMQKALKKASGSTEVTSNASNVIKLAK